MDIALYCDCCSVSGCVDVWDPKVVKSSNGSVFRLQVATDVELSAVGETLASLNCCVLLADSSVDRTSTTSLPVVDYDQIEFADYERIVLIIGGETQGLSRAAIEVARLCGGFRVRIPMKSSVDSLNSAISASILLYEIHRQLRSLR